MATFTVLAFQKLPKLGSGFMYVKRKPLLFGTLVVYFIILILLKKVENTVRPEN